MEIPLAFALAAVFATTTVAAEPLNLATGKQQLSPDEIPQGIYKIVTKETLVRYEVVHFGYSEYWGTFPGATGTLRISPKDVGATKLEVSVPIYSVDTSNRELDAKLLSSSFFDAEAYPVMTFVSTSVTRTGPKSARVVGDLTVHNIKRSVTFAVTFNGGGPSPFGDSKSPIIGFRGEGTIKRSDFGLGKFAPIVSDETKIIISSSLQQQSE